VLVAEVLTTGDDPHVVEERSGEGEMCGGAAQHSACAPERSLDESNAIEPTR